MDQQNIDFKNLFEGLTKGFSEIAAELEKRAAANQLATTVAKDANNNQMNTCPPSIVTSPTVEGDVYNFYGTVNVVVVNNRSSKDSKGFNNSKSYTIAYFFTFNIQSCKFNIFFSHIQHYKILL